jgi:BON domain-containing protein
MRPDSDIERDVKDELQWQPGLDATDVAVSVKDGVVALTGFVRRYSDKQDFAATATSRTRKPPQSTSRELSGWRTTSRFACPPWTRGRTRR